MKRNITKNRTGEKKEKKTVMHNAIDHHPLTADRCQSSDPPLPANSPPFIY